MKREDVDPAMSKSVMTRIVEVTDAQRARTRGQTKIKSLKLEEDVEDLMILNEGPVLAHLQTTIAIATTEGKAVSVKIIVPLTNAPIILHLDIEEMQEVIIEVLCLKKMEIITKMVCLFQTYLDLLSLIINSRKCKTSKFLVFNLFMNATKKIMPTATLKNF